MHFRRCTPALVVLLLTTAWSLLGCSFAPGERTPVWEYRIIDDRTLSIRSDTAGGWETWVATVVETEASVIVEVRTRMTGGGAGVFPGQPIWLTVPLKAPLGDREVIDAAVNKPVDPVP
jgi:hypothetical protein